MLYQLFEVAPRLVWRIMHFLETVEPQQFGQLVGVYPIALVAVFRDPGVVLGMRTHYTLDQRGNYCGGPRRQLTRFQMHVDLTTQIRKGAAQVCFAGGETAIHRLHALVVDGCLLKRTRPQIEPDVNFVHADVSSFWYWKRQDDYPARDICCLKLNLLPVLSSYHWMRAAAACLLT